jgi:hypothetical protein
MIVASGPSRRLVAARGHGCYRGRSGDTTTGWLSRKKVIPSPSACTIVMVFRCHGGASPEAFRVVAAGYRSGVPYAMAPLDARRTRLGDGPRFTRV